MKKSGNMRKAVFLTSNDVYNFYGNGGEKASQRNLKLLQNYFGDNNVVTVSIHAPNHSKLPPNAIHIEQPKNKVGVMIANILGCRRYYPWKEKKLIKIIKGLNPDLIFIDSSNLGRIVKKLGNIKTLIFFHNVEADYTRNEVKKDGILYLPAYLAAKKNEKQAMQADALCCLNARDANRVKELYGKTVNFFLPISFDDRFDEKRTETNYQNEILFLGSFFSPNQDAVEWFLQEVMPKLDKITFNIVGRGFEEKKEKYEKVKNVNVLGSVRETDEFYYRHSVVVMPIRYGAGMKVKTAEAMMYGRRIFASDEALEGYDIEGIDGITRCNTAQDYVIAINEYFEKRCFKKYEPSVRTLFLEKYETERVKKQFNYNLDKLLEGEVLNEGNSQKVF